MDRFSWLELEIPESSRPHSEEEPGTPCRDVPRAGPSGGTYERC